MKEDSIAHLQLLIVKQKKCKSSFQVKLWSGRAEVQISAGQIGQCCQRLATAATYFKRNSVTERNDTEMGLADSLHASAQYSEYRDLIWRNETQWIPSTLLVALLNGYVFSRTETAQD